MRQALGHLSQTEYAISGHDPAVGFSHSVTPTVRVGQRRLGFSPLWRGLKPQVSRNSSPLDITEKPSQRPLVLVSYGAGNWRWAVATDGRHVRQMPKWWHQCMPCRKGQMRAKEAPLPHSRFALRAPQTHLTRTALTAVSFTKSKCNKSHLTSPLP